MPMFRWAIFGLGVVMGAVIVLGIPLVMILQSASPLVIAATRSMNYPGAIFWTIHVGVTSIVISLVVVSFRWRATRRRDEMDERFITSSPIAYVR
jgi:membrane protein implicated in regulation of membrane protease activity